MFVAKQLYKIFFAPPPSQETYLKEYKKIIDEINAFSTEDEEVANNRHVEESYLPDAEFFRHKGEVIMRILKKEKR